MIDAEPERMAASPTASPGVPASDDRRWLWWMAAGLTLAALVVGLMLWAGRHSAPATTPPQEPAAGQSAAATSTARPDAPLPVVPEPTLAPVAPDTAREQNAAVPFVVGGLEPAAPFRWAASGDDFGRARDCLAAAVLYEAGDDNSGQRAVAQVVLNRVRHPAFPASVCAVVFQGSERRTGCQFTFTCDGAMVRTRWSDAARARARTVADAALLGNVDARVGLATHYHTDWVRPYWSDTLDKIAAIDTHLFFRWKGPWGRRAGFAQIPSPVESAVASLAPFSPAHALAMSASGVAIPTLPGAPVESGTAPATLPGVVAEVRGKPVPPATPAPARGESWGSGSADGDAARFIVVDASASSDSFVAAALARCGDASYCKVMAWTERRSVPASEPISDAARATMAFTYLRDRTAGYERSLWDCARFPRPSPRQCIKR